MATTVSYSASLCTRHYNSSSNAKNGYASQEFYDSSYNNVGIISFVGMNLANKVITSIWLDIDASKAGYGAGSTKTVFMRKANYQNGIASGIAGWQYTGDELGTFDGSFYGNYTSYYITGSLFNAMAAYIAAGNNSFTIYNPYPSASSQGYSYNYLQWSSVIITITYEEAVSQPTVSSSSVNLGSAVTIYTNRQSTATHQPTEHRDDTHFALQLRQHQRYHRQQCRRVGQLDSAFVTGQSDPKCHQRHLYDHLPEL